MTITQFSNSLLQLEIEAHEDQDGKLLMVQALAAQSADAEPDPPLRLGVVIDRSGSMSGPKLDMAKRAAAGLVASLRPIDRIAVVSYDDHIDVVSGPTAPSAGLARLIESISSGGNTNLYGGWLQGAKLLEGGGRIILLSDGLANAGRYTDARALADHARISFERYLVATSTVGIGDDYDERLMSGMARHGGGFHYFAHSVDSILETFKRERFLAGRLAIVGAVLKVGEARIELGQLLEGESKVVVSRVRSLPERATLSFMDAKTEESHCLDLALPNEFGRSDLATAHFLVKESAELMDRCLDLGSQQDAQVRVRELRDFLLRAGSHPLIDSEPLASTCQLVEGLLRRTQNLAERFCAQEASFARKRFAQTSHNLRERGKSFSDVQEDVVPLMASREAAFHMPVERIVQADALSLRPADFWLELPAAPLRMDQGRIWVGLLDPHDGFIVERLTRELGLRVMTDPRPWTLEEIREAVTSVR